MSDRVGLIVPEASDVSIESGLPPDPLKHGDIYRWALEQAALIRAGRFIEIDWVNVADEIESVGKSEFRSLASHIEIVLVHCLKWDHQADRRSRSWIGSIAEHRERIGGDLSDNPSLKSRIGDAMSQAYRLARHVAARETELSVRTFRWNAPTTGTRS